MCIYNNNNNNCCYGLRGPTGVQGPSGTLEIGTVTTGVAGSEAQVTNVGTNTAAILDFVIPQGAEGKAATIEVGTVVTGEPGTNASVENVGTDTNAILNFTIPRGEDGTSDKAYYAGVSQTDTTVSTVLTPIPFATMANNGVTINENTITINNEGTYLIQYMLRTTSPSSSVLGLLVDGRNDTQTNMRLDTDHNTLNYATIKNLSVNETISLVAVSLTDQLVLDANTVNGYLIIEQIQ